MKDLVATKTRAHYGSFELAGLFPKLWQNRGESNNRSLIRLFRDPRLWPQLTTYCLVTTIAKRRAQSRLRSGAANWERDNTSRATA
jgi:hypothetical protein